MEVKFLKAGTGDSILIHHKKNNILIDGGNDSNILLAQIDKIYHDKEIINLLIITHHDDDHIKGIIDFLKQVDNGRYGKGFVKQVIFNSPGKVSEEMNFSDEGLLSYQQAHEVEGLLKKIKPEWKQYTDQSQPLYFEDLKMTFLSPTQEDLNEYSQDKGAYLSGDFKCDWDVPMSLLEKYIDDASQDISLANRSSVVVKIECEGKSFLLTGDVTPDRLECIIDKLVLENGGNAVPINYIKLPHHGSYRSLNRRIIDKIKCNNFIISTNSTKYFLPNKRTLLKLIKYLKRDKQKIEFFFNYDEAVRHLNITDKEKRDYNINLTSNNNDYGFSI